MVSQWQTSSHRQLIMIESQITPGKDISSYMEALSNMTYHLFANQATSYISVGQGDPWHYELYLQLASVTYAPNGQFYAFALEVFAINDSGLRAAEGFVGDLLELTHAIDKFNYVLHHKEGAT